LEHKEAIGGGFGVLLFHHMPNEVERSFHQDMPLDIILSEVDFERDSATIPLMEVSLEKHKCHNKV